MLKKEKADRSNENGPGLSRKLWKGSDGDRKPTLVEVTDWERSDDRYFATEAEAWESIRRNTHAGVHLAARSVESARAGLRLAEQLAADICVEFREVEQRYEEFLRNFGTV